jgi:ERF superfamily protein
MKPTTELELAQPQAVARPAPSVADMLQAVIQKGVTVESVAAVEQLVKLYERMQERDAEKAFATAFVGLQSEMPKVQATKIVPNNDGTPRYKFAPFEDLMAQVAPMLQKHGFTVSFSSRFDASRIISTCTLQHVGGHKRANEFAVRVGQGPPKATESQADGAAATYAKRFALTEALNIVVGHLDNDARLEGPVNTPVTKEQAEELERRAKETNSILPALLKFAGAKSFSEIPASKYDALDQLLRRKEQGR